MKSPKRSCRRWLLAAVAVAHTICFANLYWISSVSMPSDERGYTDLPTLNKNGQHQPTGSSYTHHDEPYVNRWQRRFSSSPSTNQSPGGHLFFKHMRKAGGTLLRSYLHSFLEHHGHGTFIQFLRRTDRQEVLRHYPFLNDKQQKYAERYFDSNNNQTSNNNQSNYHNHDHTSFNATNTKGGNVYYMEQEFSTMDWQCRGIDPRFNNSLSIVVIRHPIEQHLSEFFYSGPPATSTFDGIKYNPRNRNIHQKRLHINRTKLHVNGTYTDMLSDFLEENLQAWMRKDRDEHYPRIFKWYFYQRYIDNYQVRALAGCASGDDKCLLHRNVTDGQRTKIDRGYPINVHNIIAHDTTPTPTTTTTEKEVTTINSVCTMHPFYIPKMMDICTSKSNPNVCQECDGPCFYPATAWGNLTRADVSRAIHALEGFDLVLITETMDDADQLSMLADVMGVPRNITSMSSSSSFEQKLGNVNTVKQSKREKLHYYRDLISRLTSPELIDSMMEENELEIELYDYAVRLNKLMTDRWKGEINWSDFNLGAN